MHIGRDVLGTRARAFFGDPSLPEGALPTEDFAMYDARWWPEPLPATADEALAFLDKTYTMWCDGIRTLDDEALLRPLGPRGDHHADQSWGALVLHINREVMAHGAEVSPLRGLYRAQRDQEDPVVGAARRDDAAEVARLMDEGVEVPPLLLGRSRADAIGTWCGRWSSTAPSTAATRARCTTQPQRGSRQSSGCCWTTGRTGNC